MGRVGTVGIIGLGIMGQAYAANLRASGFEIAGYDVKSEAMDALGKLGGHPLESANAVAAASDTVIVALASPAVVAACFDSETGVPASLKSGTVVIDTGTFPIPLKEACAEAVTRAGSILLDCPVSGTGAQAARKDLLVYASGDPAAVERCRTVFDGFARETLYVGPFGAGMKMKYIANHLVTIHNLAAAEALMLADRAGLDLDTVFQAVSRGAGTSRMFEIRAPMMMAETYEPATMKFDVYMKDVALIVDFARGVSAPTPLLAACLPFYSAALAQGRAKEDTAGLFGVLKQMSAPNVDGAA